MAQQQKALLLPEKQGAFVVGTAPIPKPGPGEILVKLEATALNPVDWGIQASGLLIEKYPAILGCDGAGTVEELGEGVTKWKKGDTALKPGQIGVNDESTFQQYCIANADVCAKIPDNMTFDSAATVPLGLGTAVAGLYYDGERVHDRTIGLSPPWEEGGRGKYKGQPIVVFSGATSVGQYAIQVAKLSGFSPIITTASLHNSEWLQGLGATHVIDRHLPTDTICAEVRKITSEPIKVVYDAMGLPETQNIGYDLLAPGGSLASVRPPGVKPEKRTTDKRVFQMYGGMNLPENRKLGASLYSKLTALLEEGAIKPNHVEVVPGGLQGIVSGLDKLKKGISNVKLVVHPQDNL